MARPLLFLLRIDDHMNAKRTAAFLVSLPQELSTAEHHRAESQTFFNAHISNPVPAEKTRKYKEHFSARAKLEE